MTIGKEDFASFRQKVLNKRKKKLLESLNENITTAADIAAVIERSQMVAGIYI